MGRRYICEYCDRSFVDELSARQKHLRSIQHIRKKQAYYSSIRDLKTLVEEESKKETCGRFQRTGECTFGEICVHSHYSPFELETFRRQLAEKEKSTCDVKTIANNLPSVEDWLAKVKKQTGTDPKTTDGLDSFYSPEASNPFLPVSLQKPPLEIFSSVSLTDWG
ncbi:unnamed protein product [Bemisia tabaci]|uniref:C3H1-type domain-containing protein n=1 Tax=Bemisia tabaci TaxID=7038 RepID=A0A9P0EY20_BEMTA|nr:PREDICTED: zinc finger matrin-type protein 5-like [Bemisia tabaci]CAH0383960.1 unnamed protein product [Bemisia tabaci]